MYLVVFRNRKRPDIDMEAYDAEADHMLDMAKTQKGFLSFKSYAADDGEVIALSEWESESAARAWGRVAEHRLAQAHGRDRYYASYTFYGCDNPRSHHFTARDLL
ncbi:antibiotic biosynthesis monooxygenase family protein [Parerythrobacter lacustris]|uniref:Antibiotic biosynthesis monooxygenase n=1 Tax=Parerythrobacter lacustris TaxID=2969984 RepID=A0ABT1XT99_9SPHN|nr:antibiotic biosynthesis monooxygenase [Parerythrobacter lacustris]MCR2834151.1 antibiotic biosynthesis monooxygenase [Parerythrobacter lacustris]